jgi:hypothetical protein
MTPMRAIRAKCLECCAGSWVEVKLCEIEGCSLHQYRFGHNPARKGCSSRTPHLNDRFKRNKTILEGV